MLCALCAWIVPALATLPPRAVLVVVPGLKAEDLTRPELASLTAIIGGGASGWMVCRAAESPQPSYTPTDRDTTGSLLVTLNAGARAFCPPCPTPTDHNLLHPSDLSGVFRANRNLDHAVSPGALGALIQSRGLTTAVTSDADTVEEAAEASLLGMDPTGRIDFSGSRQRRTVLDTSAPDGVRADPAAILHDIDSLPDTVGLVVVNLHDLNRADRYAIECLPAAAEWHRHEALGRLNSLLSELLSRCTQRRSAAPTWLILLAPGAAPTAASHDRLAPIVLWGSGIAPGTLTSASTRRAGLVVNTDLLPTLANLFGIPAPAGIVGRPIRSIPARSNGQRPPAVLRAEHDRFMATAALQDAYGGLPTVQLCLVLAIAFVLFRRRGIVWVGALAAAIVALPLGMLLLPAATLRSVPAAGVGLGAFVVLIAAASAVGIQRRWFARVVPIYGLCAALVVIGTIDLCSGMRLLREAWMSYSVVEGARYYGIGNEYMGTLIGAGCVLLSACGRFGKAHGALFWTAGAAYVALIAAMGLPQLGAKVGAIPSAGCAFGVALCVWLKGVLRSRDLLAVIAAVSLLLGAFALIDLSRSGASQSHLARALSGSGGDLTEIACRKLLLEGRLLLRSPWSAALCAAAAAIFWTRRQTQLRRSEFQPADSAALAGIAIGALVSLVCNDSGVTAAAMALLIGLAWMATSAACDPAPSEVPIATG